MELKRSADAVRLYNHWHFGKLRKYSASAADRYPFVKKNLKGAHHRNPADDQHALSENIRSGSLPKKCANSRNSMQQNKKPKPMSSAIRPSQNNSRSRRSS